MLFSMGAKAQYQINGDANQISCNCYQLSEDVPFSGGSVWNVNQINLSDPFNYNFEVWLGCDEWGADGIAFVLQPVNVNQGGGSSSLGYGGINPSLSVEVDTWPNDVTMMDPQEDHIAVMQNGVADHGSVANLAGPVVASSTTNNIEDCQWHTIQIRWEPSINTLAIFFDGVYRTSYTGDVVNDIFGGDPNVYWGWTGGTGSASADQRFCNSILPDYTVSNSTTCVGEAISFEDASLTSSGNITNYSWDFDDGSTDSGMPVTHTFNTAGTFDVNLSITTEGCVEDTVIPITIDPTPVVDLGPDID
ncbi:MAG: lectin-like domain-containing protein, partial [Flavobacteriales bacterium]